jgi:phosphoglycolate phosphatase
VFRALFPEGSRAEEANAAFESAYEERVRRGEVTEMPGAAETIGRLRAEGVRVALLTGFSAHTRDRLIEALGWQEIADLLLCPEEAGRGRPFPDMVLRAVLDLGLAEVAEVAVVGDTAADIVSGRRAGASRLVGVRSGADPEARLREAGATDVVDSVVQLPELFGLA